MQIRLSTTDLHKLNAKPGGYFYLVLLFHEIRFRRLERLTGGKLAWDETTW